MGLTKQYLRYESRGFFNVIASGKCNIKYVSLNGIRGRYHLGRYVAVGICEDVCIWDLRLGEKVLRFRGDNSEVCVIAVNSKQNNFAAGYEDGSIKIFDLTSEDGECMVTFRGHKSAITCLAYDSEGLRLMSGSKDSELVLWDIVNESGVFRLLGHKGVVTQCLFLNDNVLITSSLDATVKFWDLGIRHCFNTLVGHHCEVCDIVVVSKGKKIITGASDSNLRGWNLLWSGEDDVQLNNKRLKLENGLQNIEEVPKDTLLTCANVGCLPRLSRSRLSNIVTDKNCKLLVCHGNDRILEIYRFISDAELKKKLAKRAKKIRNEKSKSTEQEIDEIPIPILELNDEIKRLGFIKLRNKIKSADVHFDENSEVAKIVVLSNDNSIETYELNLGNTELPKEAKSKLTLQGHQSDVRCVCFSSDSTALLSASGDSLKIWNRSSQKCIRTISCDYALTAFFVPGDRHCVVGTKSGKLQLFDIASNVELPNPEGHDGAIWSVCLTPDSRGFASGGADKLVKFWEFELVSDLNLVNCKRLSVVHTRTLQLQEEVLCVRFSMNYRLIAVSLLDSTVKIFFVDTLKFFLSLFGHKFPVLCMDISDDSRLIATGSSDRNIKLWGLDFGDCHKSIFAHDDSIMSLQFIPKTHMFFTGGKDGCVKQWDGDTFQRITTLKGHHAEVWTVAVSPNGQYVASGSHDKSIRFWEKTEEIIVLEEEKEIEREEEFEKNLSNKDDTVIPGEVNKETGLPTKRNAENLKAADKIMEALDIYKEEIEKKVHYRQELGCASKTENVAAPALHPLMIAYKTPTANHFMIHILRQIKSSELEEALLFLPFSYVVQLINVLAVLIEKCYNVEICCRCLCFLLRVHHGQITANEVLLKVIDKLRISVEDRIHNLRDSIGFNLAGLRVLQNELEDKDELKLFIDASQRFKEKTKSRKRKEKLLRRAILANNIN